jgi:hypothetical protein
MRILKLVLVATAIAAVLSSPVAAQDRCANGRSPAGGMWFSILHPGLGEYFLNGWGSWGRNMPQKKFWLGWIPLFGWPGYLQVVSAIDARNCRVNDWQEPERTVE